MGRPADMTRLLVLPAASVFDIYPHRLKLRGGLRSIARMVVCRILFLQTLLVASRVACVVEVLLTNVQHRQE